jgi:hypothetical protein
MTIAELLDALAGRADCVVRPSSGQPATPPSLPLPSDLVDFYERCRGVQFFQRSDYSATIVGPAEFVSADERILGEGLPEGRSSSWFVLSTEATTPLIVIDLDGDRAGRCYDAFWDVYGVAGSMAVVAFTFTGLVTAPFQGHGRHWFWLDPIWAALGDSYDRPWWRAERRSQGCPRCPGVGHRLSVLSVPTATAPVRRTGALGDASSEAMEERASGVA